MKYCYLMIVVAVVCVGFIEGESSFKWKCKEKEMNKMNEFYDAREACKKDGVTDEFCKGVCGAKRLGILDPRFGNINSTGINERVNYHISPPDNEILAGKLAECQALFGSITDKLNTSSVPELGVEMQPPFCATRYMTYWTCFWVTFMIHCGIQFDPEIIGSELIKIDTPIPIPATPK